VANSRGQLTVMKMVEKVVKIAVRTIPSVTTSRVPNLKTRRPTGLCAAEAWCVWGELFD